ncbi:DUF2203 family protein [Cohnella endophytica]|uniref:DUF2203 family protein n=1 Tax=Cohnella endophytica TaxID=2419778 RepID=A0A494Y5U9_9BACL|nr:DUF2203 domain-containing protein [Cohnella endophytica]RKP58057.1 DUF2203 family protein [Cohnella endophytica]
MNEKLFTLEEANELLPQLIEELQALQKLAADIELQYRELQQVKSIHRQSPDSAVSGEDPYFERESRIEFMRMEAGMLMDNFARKGVQLKMISPGLLDFPAILDGQAVLMCWKEGEERVMHYHGLHEGFMGRKPLP